MSCNRYEAYELGQIEHRVFMEHLVSCSVCRERVEQDARLMALAKSLKRPLSSPMLWARIEKSLVAEKRTGERSRLFGFQRRTVVLLRAAAMVIVMVSAGILLWPKSPPSSGLLAESALKRVERQEMAYIKAIEALEERVHPKLEEMDIELALLYRDRLETIDAQIEDCREALSKNPANSHIRRYMLAALQDKKETLWELLRS